MSITIPEMFDHMPTQYNAGILKADRSYYFSLGSQKYTVKMTPESCTVDKGKTLDSCDCVLKTTDKIFIKLVVQGKPPGPIDIARGRFKTNDVGLLTELRNLFSFQL